MSDSVRSQQVEDLIDDISYLALEAESLKKIIDSVPYDEEPPGRRSMLELLVLIDFAQTSFYRPVTEKVTTEGEEPVNTADIDPDPIQSFQFDAASSPDIGTVLSRIATHRNDFVGFLQNLTSEQWEACCIHGEEEMDLYDFLTEMVRFERDKLNEIADQVMLLSQQREAQRQIDEKRQERNRFQDPSS